MVNSRDMAGFDVTTFWTGEPFRRSIPQELRLWVGDGRLPDYMANAASWEIVSAKLWGLVDPLISRGCEAIPAPVFYKRSGLSIPDYYVMNPLKRIAAVKCVDGERDLNVGNLVLIASRIPPDIHIFRLDESPTVIIVSDAFFSALRGNGITGIGFLPTSTADDDE